jgi:hypothetical protein
MKIESSVLKSFVVKATMGGALPSMVMRVSNDGITAQLKDLSNAAMTTAKLSPDKVKEKEDMVLCIKNTDMLIKSLGSFSGEVELKKNENILSIFNAERQINIVLSTEEFIDCNLPKIPDSLANAFDGGINLQTDILRKIVSDMAIVDGDKILVEVKDKKLTLNTGAKDFDNISMKVNVEYNDVLSTYGELLAKAITVIGDKVNMSLKSNFPIRLVEDADGIKCTYIIAPIVEQAE